MLVLVTWTVTSLGGRKMVTVEVREGRDKVELVILF